MMPDAESAAVVHAPKDDSFENLSVQAAQLCSGDIRPELRAGIHA